MNKKLHISLIFNNLMELNLLNTNRHMHNLIVKYAKILNICKQFAGNHVNKNGNMPRCGVIPNFSDLEVIALSITAEALGYDSENNLFNLLKESVEKIPNLISRRQYNVRRKRTARLAEEIRKDIATFIDGNENVFILMMPNGNTKIV